jgi:hypothetical protein
MTMNRPATTGKTEATKVQAITKPYDPTPEEEAACKAYHERKNRTPRVKATKKAAGIEIGLDYPDQAFGSAVLMRALAIKDRVFLGELLTEIARACTDPNTLTVSERKINFMVAVIKTIGPKDGLETLLATQMGAIHMLTMEFATRLAANANGPLEWRDSAERTLNKLARTFAAQIEALKRYRTGGEQIVRVEHVTVNSGGQAIVGNVSNRGVGGTEKR